MEQDFKEMLEEKLKGIEDELHDLNARNEIPYTNNDLDNVCDKLDTIIKLLKHE